MHALRSQVGSLVGVGRRVRVGIGLLAGAVLGSSLLVLATGAAAEATPTACSSLQVIAHRGYHYGSIAENTIRSFDESATRGYSIETDIRMDADGQLWIFHDPDVFRATGQHALFDDLTTQQVRDLRYKKGNYPLPTLQEAIARWQTYSSDIKVFVEPKGMEVAAAAVPIVQAAGLESRVYYTAQQPFINRTFPSSLLMGRWAAANAPDPQTWVDQGVEEISFGTDALTAADVDAYHARGLRVQLRTANVTNSWRTAISLGFDGILTDFPNDLKSFCPDALKPPEITSFTPTSGGPGTLVTITGAFFTDATSVKFGSTSALFTYDSPTEIKAILPENVSGEVPITVTTPAGSVTSAATFRVPLVLSSFSPASGQIGETVTITGEGFTGADRVRFGQVDAPFTVVSASQITATVPPGTPAAVKLSVRTPSGTVTSATSFKIPPVISSFTPTSGPQGTVVTITGSGFTGVTSVKFGTLTASTYTVDSDTQISAVAPAGVPGGSTLKLSSIGGQAVSTGTYGQPAPTITALSPTSGPVGTTVTVSGTGLAGATSVSFGSVPAAAFSVVSATEVSAVVPANAPASSQVKVATPDGTATSSAPFVVSAPTISSFTPTSGLPGASVTITGTNLAGATSLKFGSTAIATFTVDSATQVTATVPSDAPATGTLRLTTAGGTATSVDSFTLTKPVVAGFSPTSGPVGSSVVITGSAFTGTTSVKFGQVATTAFTVDSDGQITVTVPAGAPARAKLAVVTRAGSTQSVDLFTLTG